MSIHTTIDGQRYIWVATKRQPDTLYGHPVIRRSLIPTGCVMLLCNTRGEELALRGEPYEDRIVFFHIENGGYEIGARLLAMMSENARSPYPIAWVAPYENREEQERVWMIQDRETARRRQETDND